MYSHVLAAYQKTLLVFWAKTSKTMTAIAESFKGYQYYEFTVIKDLAEPSRLLAEKSSSSFIDKTKEENITEIDDKLIDINESNTKQTTSDNIIQKSQQKDESIDPTEPVNALIDITDSQLDDQLLELEKLTTIDQTTTTTTTDNNNKTTSNSDDNLVDLLNSSFAEHDKLFSDLLSPLPSEINNNNNINPDLYGINEINNFDSAWTAAFGNQQQQQQFPKSAAPNDSNTSNNTFLPSSILNQLLTSTNKINQPIGSSSTNSKPKPTTGKSTTDKSNWFNLFAELDPLQNPDAIGKSAGDEFDRNC